MVTRKQSDFNPEDLIATSAEHEQSLSELRKSVAKLNSRVGDSASLAKSFKDAFDNDKKMDAVLTSLVCELVATNEQFKTAVEKAVARVDRKWWGGKTKAIVGAIGAILLLAIGAIFSEVFKKLFGGN